MAIRTFNSVGGFSVGEIPANIILANGDITTTHATLTGNLTAANVSEVSKNTLKSYVKANTSDQVQRASSDSFKSGAAGDKYNKADTTHRDTMRQRGMDRALDRLSGKHGKK